MLFFTEFAHTANRRKINLKKNEKMSLFKEKYYKYFFNSQRQWTIKKIIYKHKQIKEKTDYDSGLEQTEIPGFY